MVAVCVLVNSIDWFSTCQGRPRHVIRSPIAPPLLTVSLQPSTINPPPPSSYWSRLIQTKIYQHKQVAFHVFTNTIFTTPPPPRRLLRGSPSHPHQHSQHNNNNRTDTPPPGNLARSRRQLPRRGNPRNRLPSQHHQPRHLRAHNPALRQQHRRPPSLVPGQRNGTNRHRLRTTCLRTDSQHGTRHQRDRVLAGRPVPARVHRTVQLPACAQSGHGGEPA